MKTSHLLTLNSKTRISAVAVVLLAALQPANAISINFASTGPGVSGGCGLVPESSRVTNGPAVASSSASMAPPVSAFNHCAANASARAHAGNVGVSVDYSSLQGAAGRSFAGATSTVYNLVATSSSTGTLPPVLDASVNLSFSSSYGLADVDLSNNRFPFTSLRVGSSVSGSGAVVPPNSTGTLLDFTVQNLGSSPQTVTGPVLPSNPNSLVNLPISIIPNQAFSFTLDMAARAGATSTGQVGEETVAASVNASNSLSFAKTGAVFNLPTGWTINSADGVISNNLFTGFGSNNPSGGNGNPTVVPVPASFPLLAFALTLIAWMPKIKRRLPIGEL